MGADTILLDERPGWVRVTLNRPERLNSLSIAMRDRLIATLESLRDDPDRRVILLTGAGRAFCTGQDLSERYRPPGEVMPDLGDALEAGFNRLVRLIRVMPQPVVCAVNGVAAGAGANLALACDLVLAGRSARFIESFSGVGLVPDCAGTWTLPRLVGSQRAAGLALLGDALGAEDAAAWGLIWRCVADADLAAEGEAVVAQLLKKAPLALAAIKEALAAGAGNTLDAQLDLERDLQRRLGRSDDYREGVAAFVEKRTPRFRGR